MCFTHILSFNPIVILGVGIIVSILQRSHAEPFLDHQALCLWAFAFFFPSGLPVAAIHFFFL